MTEAISETCSCGATFRASGRGPISVRNAAEDWRATHKHTEAVGICGDRGHALSGPKPRPAPFCALKAGHAGMHSDGDGAHWTKGDERE